MVDVLHITPHMGGGVGKTVSALLGDTVAPDLTHRLCCLEPPEKDQFLARVRAGGHRVDVAPAWSEVRAAIADADIVTLHFWAHPLCVQIMMQPDWPDARVIAWSHISGRGAPRFPPGIAGLVNRLVLTGAASLDTEEVRRADPDRIAVVSSGVVENLPPVPDRRSRTDGLRAVYVGTLNPVKLHPEYVTMLATVRIPGFQVCMVGDDTYAPALRAQAEALGRPDLMRFVGYQTDVPALLAGFDVLLYLLNPNHYGTGEIALLEAMAMGVIPIVCDNLPERAIVADGETGLIVKDGRSLADALDRLRAAPAWRATMAARAAESVRATRGPERLRDDMGRVYASVLAEPKRPRPPAAPVFGDTPADWFRAFLADPGPFRDNGDLSLPPGQTRLDPALFEPSKGSVFHFQRAFPRDPRLTRWADALTTAARGRA